MHGLGRVAYIVKLEIFIDYPPYVKRQFKCSEDKLLLKEAG